MGNTLDLAGAPSPTSPLPGTVYGDLLAVIEAAMTNHPRSLQTAIGPSELGMDCVRCLTHKLAGTPEVREPAWLPMIGTAVHEHLEYLFTLNDAKRRDFGLPSRWLSERRVTVGQVGGQEITGSTDLFDLQTGTVIDFKVVGRDTLMKARAKGASTQYRAQAALYARGWQTAGHTVTGVLIWFMPRNSVNLRDGYPWHATPDPALAQWALDRANTIHDLIHAVGLPAALEQAGEHTNTGFTCRRAPDHTPAAQAPALTLVTG